jgi:signal transduction histidine kinase
MLTKVVGSCQDAVKLALVQSSASSGRAGADRAVAAADLLALLDALPAIVALWDADVRLRYANRRQLSRLGRPPGELLGVHLADLVQPHAVELSARYIEGALAGRPQQVERAMVDASGQRFNAHQVTHVPNVVDGVVTGYCALAVDLTSTIEGYEQARRAREQAALRAERERIAGDLGEHRVLDDLGAALRRLDAAIGRASDAVPSLATAADAIERTIAELRATVPNRMARDAAGPERLAAFPEHTVPFADPGPPPTGVPAPATVTGGGWGDAELRALLDLVPAAVAIWDNNLANRYGNTAAVRWFGRRSAEELLGQGPAELIGSGVFAEDLSFARAALAGTPGRVDRTVVQPSGLRHVQVSYLPRRRDGSADGPVEGIYTFLVDVTARVEAELALQDARAGLAAAQERQRIADELHNLVIQRLFAASLAATLPTTVTEAHLRSVQDGIVAALDELESALSSLHEQVGVLDLLPELAGIVHGTAGGLEVSIESVGSVEYVPPGIAAELLAVAHAALSNVVAHAEAGQVVVTLAADSDAVWLRVVDDGRGLAGTVAGAGMADMRRRAERLGGTSTWRAAEPSGTLVDWRVPIPH